MDCPSDVSTRGVPFYGVQDLGPIPAMQLVACSIQRELGGAAEGGVEHLNVGKGQHRIHGRPRRSATS